MNKPYSRENPSPFYALLIAQYMQMHSEGYISKKHTTETAISSDDTFPGFSVTPFKDNIKELIVKHNCETMLDYGCGKGEQYSVAYIDNPENLTQKISMAAYLGLPKEQIFLYEPALNDKSNSIPEADIVISTDVLEHCHMADIPWIIEEMFQKARKALFANIAGYAAKAHIPNGENAHISIRPGVWWAGFFQAIAARYPHVDYVVSTDEFTEEGHQFRVFSNRPVHDAAVNTFTQDLTTNTYAKQITAMITKTYQFG